VNSVAEGRTDLPLNGVVTVGTDHHRFDRLMDWLEHWDARHPGAVRWVVQHGYSRPMCGADGFVVKPRGELLQILREADVVVTQGGPGGIMDSRECGTVPIVVPRLGRLNEAVDNHQVAFAEQLARNGLLEVAKTEEELFATLDRAVADITPFRVEGSGSDVTATVSRFGAAVEELLTRKPPRHRRGRPEKPVV
jgi:UDP-N-acetylglucosamine transferase subunit ALG13